EILKNRNRIWRPEQLLSIALQNKNTFEPGQGWEYSNTNWILAEKIIENVSGQSLKKTFDTHFLGQTHFNLLNNYYFPEDLPYFLMQRMVHGYDEDNNDISFGNMSWAAGAGGIISDAEDLASWAFSLFHGKILPKKQLDEMMDIVSVETGKPVS